jgi:hypothetical protein
VVITMGTDILLFVEKRNTEGKWEAVTGKDFISISGYTYILNNLEYYSHQPKSYWEECLEVAKQEKLEGWLWIGRSYALFAILANKRNAEVSTGNGFNPISKPKGFPKDASCEVRERYDYWGKEAHAASYLSLEKLLDYDWNQVTTKWGWVDQEEFKTFIMEGKPSEYSTVVSESSTVKINNETMHGIVAGTIMPEADKSYYTRVEWMTAYKDSEAYFYKESIPKLKEIAGDDPESVRIVFWFDS